MGRRRQIISVYCAGIAQGIALVTFPAASSIFTSAQAYHLTSAEFGALFAPLAVTAIGSALLSAVLTKRLGVKRLFLCGLIANVLAMLILILSTMVMTRHDLVYPILLAATASMGIGFGFTVPALNTIAAGLFPQKTDIAVLAMNAVLGLGTALAPVFIAIFVGVGWWWGLPTMVGIAISGLFLNCWHQPLAQGAMPEVASTSDPAHGLPGKFWVFAVFMILYGICETMNGTWATLFMTQHTGASATMASIALTAFWGMVTAGRVLFFMTERWLPERMVFRLLSVVVIAGFVLDAMATKKAPLVGITACALAGLGCSALLPLAISFSQEDMPRIAASVSGGLIACYQIGYGLAAFGVGMLHDHLHIDLNHLFATAAVVAVAMAIVAFPLAHASARQTAQRAV